MDVARIMVCIPFHNRLELASRCVPTLRAGMRLDDVLVIYDDGSDERVSDETRLRLLSAATGVVQTKPGIGVDAQRRKHFNEFVGNRETHGCTHLYLTDSDSPHDPLWREKALDFQARYKAPVCLYRTLTHAGYHNNVFRDDPSEDVIWQRFAPGVSYLLDMAMCEKVVAVMPDQWNWDWFVPSVMGYRMAVSRTSYCDHIGMGGQHDPAHGVGSERAIHPTGLLMEKRAEILSSLGSIPHALNP